MLPIKGYFYIPLSFEVQRQKPLDDEDKHSGFHIDFTSEVQQVGYIILTCFSAYIPHLSQTSFTGGCVCPSILMNSNAKIITERKEGKETLNWKKFDFYKNGKKI